MPPMPNNDKTMPMEAEEVAVIRLPGNQYSQCERFQTIQGAIKAAKDMDYGLGSWFTPAAGRGMVWTVQFLTRDGVVAPGEKAIDEFIRLATIESDRYFGAVDAESAFDGTEEGEKSGSEFQTIHNRNMWGCLEYCIGAEPHIVHAVKREFTFFVPDDD